MRQKRRSTLVRQAFAPAHVTGIFAPAAVGGDPRSRGSVGAGIVLEVGVNALARWRPARRSSLTVCSTTRSPLPISTEVAQHLLAGRVGHLEVQLSHSLPIGQGFGMSAAGALATALATGAVLKLRRRKEVETAHLADLFGGGGLGGVTSILGGGWEIRDRPGAPPHGRARHRPFLFPVILSVTGAPIPSPRLLTNEAFLERVRLLATEGLERLARDPTASRLLDESETFTDQLGLAPPSLVRAIRSLRRKHAYVAQAMFGRSLFAVPRSASARPGVLRELERRGLRGVELFAARRGASIVRALRR